MSNKSSESQRRLMDSTDSNPGTPQRRYSVDNALGASMSSLAEASDRILHEKQFLLSAERGDIGSVRKLLELAKTPGTLNINCVDPLGRSALHIAVENENIEMIELLLDNNIETGDAILYAIGEENVEAVEIILEHLEKIEKFNPETQGVEINEHSAFTPDITPIILAAHKDNYECIKLFLDKKATIPHPHDVRCCCKDCLHAKSEDSLCLSRSRINAYRALASPSLICLSAKDPILYAFELSYELRRLSYIENEFRSEYQELSQKCQKFSVNMLDQVRGSKELEIVLNHTTNAWEEVTQRKSLHLCHQLARLKLAVQLRQKRFVAHPNCQQLLAAIFYEGIPGFRNRHIVFKVLFIICVSISFPILSIVYIAAPKSSIAEFTRKPFIKFLCHSASYCFFLFLLILASQRINYDNIFRGSSTTQTADLDPDRKERRGPPPTPVEWAILAWVIGLIWVEIKQLWDAGLHDYCYNLWNILDFITNSLYLCTFALRSVAYYQVEAEMRNPMMQHIGRRLQRRDWDAWDPTLISECVFATANIFSSLKLVHIFTVNPHLGPLRISLGRMVIDILKFFLVYCLVLFAFACGLNQLMWYYAAMRQQECEQYKIMSNDPYLSRNPTKQMKSFEESCDPKYRSCASLYKSMETLFWSSFGLIGLENLDIVEQHGPTQWTGRTIFGSYCCCSIIVLLNMLIAMMSNSYENIYNQADIEWKFARSKLWIEYFDDTATLPPPFNMIPSPKSFYYGIRWLCDKFCRFSRRIQQGKQRSMRNQKILRVVNKRENNYRFVMRNLVKRYIAQMQRCKQQSEGVSEDDVNEIKQDISAFRYELLGILRNAGFNTGHTDINQKTFSRNKKKSAMAERRLKKGLPDTFSIPMPESFNSSNESRTGEASPLLEGSKLTPLKTSSLNWANKLRKMTKRVSFMQAEGELPSSNVGRKMSTAARMSKKTRSLDQEFAGTHLSSNLHDEWRKIKSVIPEDEILPSSERISCGNANEPLATPEHVSGSNVSEDVSRRRSRLAKQERQMDETVLEIEHDDMLL
uniref:Transient receptor potential-gamma protein n=1 Tax=Ascaris suum TaxID=6253 RepID=F1KU57_ASCSU